MWKKSILLITAAICWQITGAQEASPVVLVNTSGKVVYRSPGAKGKQKLVDGAVLKSSGTIQLKKAGAALLLADGKFRQVQGKNTFSLAEQFSGTGDGGARMNFDVAFGDYLMSAVHLAASPENANDAWGTVRSDKGTGDGWGTVRSDKGTGDGWGTVRSDKGTGDGWGTVRSDKGTGDGWGGKGNQIRAIQPFGKVISGASTFSWSRPAGNRTFKVTISDMSNKVVLETTTRDTFWSTDLLKAPFQANGTYQWNVSSDDSPAAVSNTLSFELSDAAERDAALERAKRAPSYAQHPASVQRMMHAVALERSDFFGDAAQMYRELQRENPKNEMIRLMHAAFWVRYGLKEVAAKAYKE